MELLRGLERTPARRESVEDGILKAGRRQILTNADADTSAWFFTSSITASSSP